jgi:hypothetical protein
MKWLRLQVVLLAIAVSVASAQCIVTCAAQPCHDSSVNQIPQCHRHHSPKQQDGPQRCQHPFFVAEGRGRAVISAAPVFDAPMALIATVEIPRMALAVRLRIHGTSPPGSLKLDFSTILRV